MPLLNPIEKNKGGGFREWVGIVKTNPIKGIRILTQVSLISYERNYSVGRPYHSMVAYDNHVRYLRNDLRNLGLEMVNDNLHIEVLYPCWIDYLKNLEDIYAETKKLSGP